MDGSLSKNRIQGLSANINYNSAILILGTLPGKMSLNCGKYYADSSNKFWDILFIACGEKIDKTDQGKEKLLEKYHIALWDILASAVRKTPMIKTYPMKYRTISRYAYLNIPI